MANGDNGGLNGSGPLPNQQPIPMHNFKCANPQCGLDITARAPMPQTFNLPTVSGVVISHERVTRCPGCQQAYVCMIGGITVEGLVQFAWTPLSMQPQSHIQAPTGADIELVGRSKLKM